MSAVLATGLRPERAAASFRRDNPVNAPLGRPSRGRYPRGRNCDGPGLFEGGTPALSHRIPPAVTGPWLETRQSLWPLGRGQWGGTAASYRNHAALPGRSSVPQSPPEGRAPAGCCSLPVGCFRARASGRGDGGSRRDGSRLPHEPRALLAAMPVASMRRRPLDLGAESGRTWCLAVTAGQSATTRIGKAAWGHSPSDLDRGRALVLAGREAVRGRVPLTDLRLQALRWVEVRADVLPQATGHGLVNGAEFGTRPARIGCSLGRAARPLIDDMATAPARLGRARADG
jgi:hypothetical protein